MFVMKKEIKAPVENAPVKKAPVENAPVKKAPVKKAPVKKTVDLVLVNIKDINRGDTIYLDKSATTPWLVIDVGSPFVLIENLHTHFASLYHGTEFYKCK